jgi:hypothetical protein
MERLKEWLAIANEHRTAGLVAFAILVGLLLALRWLGGSSQVAREYRAALKGWWGELKVRCLLRVFFFGRPQWHDVYVACEWGITQIDHVLVHRKGIFVIETKNHRTPSAAKALRQNEEHCKAIRRCLEPGILDTSRPDGGGSLVTSVVALVGNNLGASVGSNVRDGLFATWKFVRDGHASLSEASVKRIADGLSTHLRRPTKEIRSAHRCQRHDSRPAAELLRQWGRRIETTPPFELEDELAKQRLLEHLGFLREHRNEVDRASRGAKWSNAEEQAVRDLYHKHHVDVGAIGSAAGRSERAIEFRLKLPVPAPRHARI